MKRKMVILQLVLLFISMQAGAVLAEKVTDNGPGCGLGLLAWADYERQTDIAPQVMMATTNGWGSNTFAISSGTSKCENSGKVMAKKKVKAFASINFESLSQDMARGQGEHLASFATLMGVPVEHQPEFFVLTQAKYTTLIQAGENAPMAMITALHEAMAGHPVLAKLSVTH